MRTLFGIPIAAVRMADVVARVDAAIASRTSLQIGVVNAAKLVNMRRDDRLLADVLSSDLVLADGMAVVWASRLLRQPLPERVAGIDLMHAILARGSERGYRVFCLGATPEVLARVVARFGELYPGVEVAGARDGYFSPAQDAEVAETIRRSGADVLFVAITSPRKEEFLGRWSRSLGVPVCHGVGGSFDVVAGKVRRAPLLWQRLGLEWLYRVLQEPRRLWRRYLVTNLLFARLTLAELFRTVRPAQAGERSR